MNSQSFGKRIAQRYTRHALIGQGGMGKVYRAEDIKTGREVALKVIRGQYNTDAKTRRRFFKEARALAHLKHPHIVEIYDFGHDDEGNLFLAMELVEGYSLRALQSSMLPLFQILNVVDQLLQALAHAHARGVTHRDLKPENVLITQSLPDTTPIVKLVDFGLARLGGAGSVNMSQTGSVIGTPSYMAPEQARGRRGVVGPSTDIYAVGVMLYELVCNRLPYEADGGIELIIKHVQADIPPLAPREDLNVPRELEGVVHKAMAKKPWQRFGHAVDFLKAIRALEVPFEPMRPIALPVREAQETGTPASDVVETPRRSSKPSLGDGSSDISLRTPGLTPASRPAARSGVGWRKPPQQDVIVPDENVEHTPTPQSTSNNFSSVGHFNLSQVLGRDEELERLEQIFDRAVAGHGQVVVVQGEEGIGKSRLVRLMMHRFTETGLMRSAVGLYSATDGAGPNIGIRAVFEALFGTVDFDRTSMRRRTRQILVQMGVQDSQEQEQILEFLRPTREVSGELGNALVGDGMAEQRARRFLLQRLIRRFSRDVPLILLFEDIHWSSDGITDFLDSLATSFRQYNTACVVVCTLQPREVEAHAGIAEGLGHLSRFEGSLMHRVDLERLDTPTMRQLLTNALPLDETLALQLASRSGGNPLFGLQLLKNLQQDQHRVHDEKNERWCLQSEVSIDRVLPSSIADALRRRIKRTSTRFGKLADTYSQLLVRMALMGEVWDYRLLDNYLRREDDTTLLKYVEDALEAWLKQNILREVLDRQEDILAFDHSLMREVVLEMTPPRKLRKLHRLAAEVKRDFYYPFLAPVAGDIAEHFRHAGDLGQASEYLLLAARAREGVGHFREAMSLYEELLNIYRVLNPDGHRSSTSNRAIPALQRSANSTASGVMPIIDAAALKAPASGILPVVDDANITAGSGMRHIQQIDWSEVWLGLGRIALAQGDCNRAEPYVKELVDYAEARELLLPQARANWLLGRIATRRGAFDEAWEHYTHARDLFEAEADTAGVAQCLWGTGQVARMLGWLDESERAIREAMTIYEGLERPLDVAACQLALGWTKRAGGMLHDARDEYEQAKHIFAEAEDRYHINYAMLGLGDVDRVLGDIHNALHQLEAIQPLFAELGDRFGEPQCLQTTGQCLMALGQLDAAEAKFERALEIYRDLQDSQGESQNLRLRAELLRWKGNNTEALQFITQVINAVQLIGDRRGEAQATLERARIVLELGDPERAEEYLRAAHDLYMLCSDDLGIVACTEVWILIAIARGQLEEARSAAVDGLEIARRTRVQPWIARLAMMLLYLTTTLQHFQELRAIFEVLEELDIDLGNIGEPAFARSLHRTLDAVTQNPARLELDLRARFDKLRRLRARLGSPRPRQ